MTEKGCHNINDESYPELEVTVAALSGGPVGPSDRYDLFNKTLIMATWYLASYLKFFKSLDKYHILQHGKWFAAEANSSCNELGLHFHSESIRRRRTKWTAMGRLHYV